jgi:hypothetical protein
VTRSAYSKLLCQATSVGDSDTIIGAPPAGYLWVCRFIATTFGSFSGFVGMSFAVQDGNPRLWITQTAKGNYWGTHDQTFYWEGRFVVPAGSSLHALASPGDAGDISVSGYQLQALGD